MLIKQLSIIGFRGFSKEQNLELALPNGEDGSGLTVLVGPNNSGKSTIIESFKIISVRRDTPTFSQNKRNKQADDRIKISATVESGKKLSIETVAQGGSECLLDETQVKKNEVNIFVLPSRRTFDSEFGKGDWDRKTVFGSTLFGNKRGETYQNFTNRIFQIYKDPTSFNSTLRKVIDKLPEWTIDRADNGGYFIKFNYEDGSYHNSDGAGEGLLSVFTIVDALYDSAPKETIVIDEPELSLHPALQKKVLSLLLEYSADRQIIISTHSPFFISWESLINGGKLLRVVKESDGINIHSLSSDAPKIVMGLSANINNPHILGLDAKEVFFLEDNINIVEGQEDVIFYKRILSLLEINLEGTFYGWGIGGSGNLSNILILLKSLGFKKINCILDNNMTAMRNELSKSYPEYSFICIPTDDVRDKNEIKAREAMIGLIDSGGKTIKPEYIEPLKDIFSNINEYFRK